MKKTILSILLVMTFLAQALPVMGAGTLDETRTLLKSATPQQKARVIVAVREKYPRLPLFAAKTVVSKYPLMPAKIAAARAKFIAQKHPGFQVKAPRMIIENLTRDNPTLLMDKAVDISRFIMDNYPELPSDLMKWKARQHPKSQVMEMITKNHPTLKQDVISVIIEGKYPARLAAIRSDVASLVRDKHPGLAAGIKADLIILITQKYPDLPAQIARIRENPDKNPRFAVVEMICRDYPGLIPEAMEVIRDKHGAKINSLAIDVLKMLETKHGATISNLIMDVTGMIAEKHPKLAGEIMAIRVSARESVTNSLEKKYPRFQSELTKHVASQGEKLTPKVISIMEANFPGLNNEMEELIRVKFPRFKTDLENSVTKKYPDLTKVIKQALNR